MIRKFHVVVVSLCLGLFASAQSPVAALFERQARGEDVGGELEALAGDETAAKKDRFNATYLLAVAAIGKKDLEAAKSLLARAESLEPNTAQVAVRSAERALLGGEIKEAQRLIDDAAKKLKGKKSDLAAREQIVRARIEIVAGEAKAAAPRLEKLMKARKSDWEPAFFLGAAFESLDKPQDCLAAYETCIERLPKTDPCPGVYALQRWSALAVSSENSSYGNKKLLDQAIGRYETFLERAAKNGVPDELQANVRQTIGTLKMFAQH